MQQVNPVLDAEHLFRARLHLPNTTNPYVCAVALVLRAPWIVKTFGDVHDVLSAPGACEDTREACYENVVKLFKEHKKSITEASTITQYSADEIRARQNACEVRAEQVLKWALRYDIAQGTHDLFRRVALVDRWNQTDRKHCTAVTFTAPNVCVTTRL